MDVLKSHSFEGGLQGDKTSLIEELGVLQNRIGGKRVKGQLSYN